ncbi:MAG: 4'-phosphopantetheinyl transferase superfamily protein [Bacteroidota bacterium]|nr:4'-phosphopantetheinyl transferase superfamily protein [Bacteroidota bacterium]
MTVIGNDMLDLTIPANKNTLTRKGINKFFTSGEMEFAQKTSFPHPIACLWTMKESAYKCLLKLGHNKAFSPAKFSVQIISDRNPISGKVIYDNHVFWCKCTKDKHLLTCVASNDQIKLDKIKNMNLRLSEYSGKSEQIISRISKCLHNNHLVLRKIKNNIPVLTDKLKNQYVEISLSGENKLYFISILPEWVSINNKYSKGYLYESQ